jgi:ribosomal protein L11 methyltransferase
VTPNGVYSAPVPYRIVVPPGAHERNLDRLVELGALDVELSAEGGLAALMPDRVAPAQVADVLGVGDLAVEPAVPRDAGSVWMLSPRPVQIGRLRIVPEHAGAAPGSLRLIDGPSFGTGFHPTTALCVEMLEEIVQQRCPEAMLDVGTGTGILALSALLLGVPRATGIDVEPDAVTIAGRNAELNGLGGRLSLIQGGPDTLGGSWPLVVANILAAPLMEMASVLVRRVGQRGELLLSGIPASLEREVAGKYTRLGMARLRSTTRHGWVALLLRASW